jgi:hypothetical protein
MSDHPDYYPKIVPPDITCLITLTTIQILFRNNIWIVVRVIRHVISGGTIFG